MKQGHVGMIFLTIWMICFSMLLLSRGKYRRVQEEKQRVEKALLEAVKYAGEEYSSVLYASLQKKQKTLENGFFESLYVSMGVFGNKEEQEMLRMYVPMIMIAEEDGVSCYHIGEKNEAGKKTFSFEWTEKTEYSWEESDTEGVRKQKVVRLLETKASEIITNHNYIAEQYGISYSFFVPRFLQETIDEINFPMLFVVFQGWPLNADKDTFYENCIDAGVFLQEVKQYIVTVSDIITDTHSYYHEKGCSVITKNNGMWIPEKVTKEEAVRKYGALPCRTCNP